MSKTIISIIAILILAAGIGVFFVLQKPASETPIGKCGDGVCDEFEKRNPNLCQKDCAIKNKKEVRDSFFEVHMEPIGANQKPIGGGAEDDHEFRVLSDFVNLADQYKVKLTLLFTPQWAEMITRDNEKLSLVQQWQSNGHEIGGHHHGPTNCAWDGYTNLDPNSQEFQDRRNNTAPCPPVIEEQCSEYLGDMDNDFMRILNKLATIKTITMDTADVDWPEGALYEGGGNCLRGAISEHFEVIFNGRMVYKLGAAPFLRKGAPFQPPSSTKCGSDITVEDLKSEYLSSREGVFGVVAHTGDYERDPEQYLEWFEFLKGQDPSRKYSKTISQIIEEKTTT